MHCRRSPRVSKKRKINTPPLTEVSLSRSLSLSRALSRSLSLPTSHFTFDQAGDEAEAEQALLVSSGSSPLDQGEQALKADVSYN
jgi:hypothetical protein